MIDTSIISIVRESHVLVIKKEKVSVNNTQEVRRCGYCQRLWPCHTKQLLNTYDEMVAELKKLYITLSL